MPNPIPTGCAHNCGGSCVLAAHVQNGRVVQVTTDERPDRSDDLQLRACLRGRAYRRRVYHPDRLTHPLRRTGPRGEGTFERITWDEALDAVAGELRRVIDAYGNAAVYLQHGSGGLAQLMGSVPAARLLNLLGGHLEWYGSYSAACIEATVPITLGTRVTEHPPTDYRNARLILLWGHNPAETTFGTNTPYRIQQAREAGARVIVVDPRHTPTAAVLADEWLPIRPGTDVALISALAYVLVTENLHDQAFLDSHCLGFDETRLPPGVPPGESYRAYVLGQADGVPKTPAWAEAITRIPAPRIARLARELAAARPVALVPGYAPQRRAFGEQFVRACIALAAVTGSVGLPGGSTGAPGAPPQFTPLRGLGAGVNPVPFRIPAFRWTDAVADSARLTPRRGLRGGDRLPSDVKLVYNVASNVLVNQHADCNRTAALLRDPARVEFIVVQDQFLTPSARFADVVLPAVTWLEMDTVYQLSPRGHAVVALNQAMAPRGECRSDYAICAALADRLGVGEAYRAGRTEEDWLREAVQSVQAQDPACPDYDTLRQQGVYTARWDPPVIPLADFRADPAAHPLDTPSGKIEIFSTVLWDWGDPDQVPAVPKYIPEPEGGPPAPTGGCAGHTQCPPQGPVGVDCVWDPDFLRYPLQLLGPHTFRRTHSTLEEVDWLEEALPHHVALNPADAAARAIADGDVVRVFNDRGAIVLPCQVTPRVMPGVTVVPQGAWWTPGPDGVDHRGCVNVLTSQRATPWCGGTAQHSASVEIEQFKAQSPKPTRTHRGLRRGLRQLHTQYPISNTQLAWHVDLGRCTGCRTCQIACKDAHDLPMGVLWRRVEEHVAGDYEARGEALVPHVHAYYVPVACNHCLGPPCVDICPAGALSKRPGDGLVLMDASACLGCGDCEAACPYGAIQVDSATGLASKCDFCADLVTAGRDPICVSACPMRALDWGTLAELRARHGDLASVPPLPNAARTCPALVITPRPPSMEGDGPRN